MISLSYVVAWWNSHLLQFLQNWLFFRSFVPNLRLDDGGMCNIIVSCVPYKASLTGPGVGLYANDHMWVMWLFNVLSCLIWISQYCVALLLISTRNNTSSSVRPTVLFGWVPAVTHRRHSRTRRTRRRQAASTSHAERPAPHPGRRLPEQYRMIVELDKVDRAKRTRVFRF